jgi:hypothetical protein
VKYLLVREDDDGAEQLWGKCAGTEGLFVDPVPPPREVLVLRGCRPSGLPAGVLASSGASLRGLGDVCVEVSDGGQPVQWWTLADAVVVACRPHPADPALQDIVLGASVKTEMRLSGMPAAPRFELFAGTTAAAASAGECSAIDGLFRPRTAPAPVPVELIGCEPAEPLLGALRRPRPWERDWAYLLVLDQHGAVMASRTVGLAIAGAWPSVLGGTLIDVTLADGGDDDRPPPAVRPVWEKWYQGTPAEPNLWAPFDTRGRAEWLELTTRAWREPVPGPDRSGGEYHLDGRFATDIPGLHCAMAEALLGPGRYFGREWQAFRDCLGGGFGVIPPFTLTWHDSEVARRALADAASSETDCPTYFEDIVQFLGQRGVTVALW